MHNVIPGCRYTGLIKSTTSSFITLTLGVLTQKHTVSGAQRDVKCVWVTSMGVLVKERKE